MDKMPEAVRPMMEARAKVRSMLGKGYSSYGDLERAAVLTGTHPMGKGSLDVKPGRWSFHPDGYFVRYFPTGYSQTLIQLQVPSGYSVKRDNLNRITSVSNDLGQGLEIEYDSASAPVPLDGESKVKACAFTSLRLVQFKPVGPETGKLRQTIQPQKGWTLMGECSGKARFKNAPEAYSGLKQRYENALALDAEAKRVIKASRKYGRSSAGGSLSILSKADIADLGHLLVALQSASTGGAKNPSAGASDPVAFVLEAWQRALCEQAGAGIDFRGKSTPTPKAFPPAGAGFWEAPPAPTPPGTEGPKFPEFDPTAGAATPGNTSSQRLLPSATPTQEQPEEPCKEKIVIAIRTGDGQDKYCFSEAAPGKLEFTLEASVTPGALADEVTWTLPDLQGSTRVMSPANGKGRTIKVTYSGLPKNNSDFGPKKITAVVIKDRCQAQAEKEVRLFFPLLAKNNSGGADPNWFYYWKQTSACVGPARYGGDALKCNISSGSRDLGYYRSNAFDTVYNICDLKALGPDFPFNAKQWVGVKMSDVRVTGIDTFAVACQHENAHYSHFTQWWKKYQTADKFLDTNKNGILDEKEKELDKDGDLVPDALEKGLQLDPTNRNTYGIGPNGDDEEVLCWFAEATWKIGKADKEDWAKPGKQWK